jgi:hypothetical protein
MAKGEISGSCSSMVENNRVKNWLAQAEKSEFKKSNFIHRILEKIMKLYTRDSRKNNETLYTGVAGF